MVAAADSRGNASGGHVAHIRPRVGSGTVHLHRILNGSSDAMGAEPCPLVNK